MRIMRTIIYPRKQGVAYNLFFTVKFIANYLRVNTSKELEIVLNNPPQGIWIVKFEWSDFFTSDRQ